MTDQPQAVKISAAVIGRDEGPLIYTSLGSLRGFDEIVYVDTGSSDESKDAAEHYTDKIYDFEWCDDFSAARNFAMDKCTNKWVFQLDCDETLTTPLAEVRSALECGARGYLDVKIISPQSYHYYPRLVEKNEFVKWKGICHPYLSIWDGWRKSDIEIAAGRSPNHDKDPDRDLRMCEDAVREDENPRHLFYMARAWANRKEWESAISWLNMFFERPYLDFYKAEAHLLMAKCYRMTGNMIKSREHAEQAWTINPDFREAADFLAFISHGLEQSQWQAKKLVATNDNVLFYRRHDWLS